MSISHITTYVSDGLALLPQQYKGKPRMEAWLTAYLTKLQAIEDVAWTLFVDRCLQNGPTGDLLAKLGELVGQGNLGLTDDAYTLLIKCRILVNRSDGRKQTMVRIAHLLSGSATGLIMAFDLPRTTFYIQVPTAYIVNPYIQFSSFFEKAIGAGVRLLFAWSAYDSAHTLTWGSSYVASGNPTVNQSPGSSYVATVDGGRWAGVRG